MTDVLYGKNEYHIFVFRQQEGYDWTYDMTVEDPSSDIHEIRSIYFYDNSGKFMINTGEEFELFEPSRKAYSELYAQLNMIGQWKKKCLVRYADFIRQKFHIEANKAVCLFEYSLKLNDWALCVSKTLNPMRAVYIGKLDQEIMINEMNGSIRKIL